MQLSISKAGRTQRGRGGGRQGGLLPSPAPQMMISSDLPVSPLSNFFCAKLKTKFDNVRLVRKKRLGQILSFTNHTFAWLPARTNSRGGRRALHVGDFSINYMEKALTLNPIKLK
jgi:hypothetical protein